MAGFFFIYFQHGWRPGMAMPDSGHIYLTATTMSLAGIIATQIGNVFACKTEKESLFELIPLRKGGIRGLCFSRGYFTTPDPPLLRGIFISTIS